MTNGITDLKGMNLEELEEFFVSLGEHSFRGKQAMKWIYMRGLSQFEGMTDFGKKLRSRLEGVARISRLELLETQRSASGDTIKFLFGLEDGNTVESVLMSYEDHLGPFRWTACVSTQVGCAMGCLLCASGKAGLVRSLSAAEIVDQVVQMHGILATEEKRIANVVIMGMGEPLANYGNTIRALKLMNHPDGLAIGARHIAISTCGLVPAMDRLADEELKVKLAVSLHGTTDEVRSRLIPINRKYPIRTLMEACRRYQAKTGHRVTFEYALIEGLNDTPEDADRLGRLLKGLYSIVNLIPLNPVEEFPHHSPPREVAERFRDRVEKFGIKTTIRKERGKDIDAACGQLRRRRMAGEAVTVPAGDEPAAGGTPDLEPEGEGSAVS